MLVTACVSADTVSAKAYASHSRLGTCCSCPFYDIWPEVNVEVPGKEAVTERLLHENRKLKDRVKAVRMQWRSSND